MSARTLLRRVKLKDLEVDLPSVEELEEFVRLGRFGRFTEAKSYFLQNLRMYTDIFPVVAEYADLLLEQNLFGDLTEFLFKVLEDEPKLSGPARSSHKPFKHSADEHLIASAEDTAYFTSNELHLMSLLYSVGTLHTKGSMSEVLVKMRRVKGATMEMSRLTNRQKEHESRFQLDDTEIQILTKCVQIAMFATMRSNWVSWEDFQLPWITSCSRQDVLSALQDWCLRLIQDGRTWEATDILKVLLEGHLWPHLLPQEADRADVEEGSVQESSGERDPGPRGGAEKDVVIERFGFFDEFIKTLGDCQFNYVKLLSRFAAREAYCSLLQDSGHPEIAAELLDLMRLDIELLLHLDLESTFSRQFVQWAFLQNTLLEQYNGLNMAPTLEGLLPITQKLADYPMEQKIFQQLGIDNRIQLAVGDRRVSETSCLRYMQLSETISEKRTKDIVRLGELVCDEFDLIKKLSDKVEAVRATVVLERCKSLLKDFRKNHPGFDVPRICYLMDNILEPSTSYGKDLPSQRFRDSGNDTHSASVHSVQFSPDGRILASASSDKSVKLWDTATGVLLKTLEGHSLSAFSVAFSPDGRVIASGSMDKSVKLWDTATGVLLKTLEGHSALVYSVAFSPDGRVLASNSVDKTVNLWNIATSSVQITLEYLSGWAEAVVFSPDGRALASGSSDRTVKLWDTTTGTIQKTFKGHSALVCSVAFSPDGQLLASGSFDETVKLWDTTTGSLQITLSGHTGRVKSVAFSPSGGVLASGSMDKTVKLWDTATGTLLKSLTGYTEWVQSVTFSPDGRVLASGAVDKTVKHWDTAIGSLQGALASAPEPVMSVTFSPNGRALASGSMDKTVKLWDTAMGALKKTLEGHSAPVNSVAFSPNGEVLASASSDKTVKLWDTATGAILKTLEGHSLSVYSVVFSPSGRVLASGSTDRTIKIWDTVTGTVQKTLEGHSTLVTSVAFSPNGEVLASGSMEKTIKLWDTVTGTVQKTLEGHSAPVNFVVFSPNSETLASGSMDKTVKLWDTTTGSAQMTLEGHSNWIESVAFSPDGRALASGSSDSTVRLWNTATGAAKGIIEGHSASVRSVAFSPDGGILASGSFDRTVRLWNTATLALLRSLGGHSDRASFPDARVVALGAVSKAQS